jgi:hypothetical protein
VRVSQVPAVEVAARERHHRLRLPRLHLRHLGRLRRGPRPDAHPADRAGQELPHPRTGLVRVDLDRRRRAHGRRPHPARPLARRRGEVDRGGRHGTAGGPPHGRRGMPAVLRQVDRHQRPDHQVAGHRVLPALPVPAAQQDRPRWRAPAGERPRQQCFPRRGRPRAVWVAVQVEQPEHLPGNTGHDCAAYEAGPAAIARRAWQPNCQAGHTLLWQPGNVRL